MPNPAFAKWYQKNKDAFNAKRKKQYQEDPAVREKVLARQRVYRVAVKDDPSRVAHVRKAGNVEKTVYRIGHVAEQIGRDEQVIRIWERRGWIPKPTVSSSHRYYTVHQIELLRQFAAQIDQVRYKAGVRRVAILKASMEVHALWEQSDGDTG